MPAEMKGASRLMHESTRNSLIPSYPTERPAIPQLNVIRVLALLGIFSHHLWKTIIVEPQGPIQKVLDIVFSTASDGVILFNILSGFLLSMPYLGPEHRPFPGYRSFLRKRFFRIVPPYYLALLLFTWANILRFDVPSIPAFKTLLQHLLFVNSLDYANMDLNFAHFWYLGLLAQFYFLFPIVLGFFLLIGPARAALSIIALCWGSWMILDWCFPSAAGSYPGMAENLMHFNLPGRLPEFALGMWLASLWSSSSVRRRLDLGKPFAWFTTAMVIYVLAMTFVDSSSMNLSLIHMDHVALSLILFVILLVGIPAGGVFESAVLTHIAEQSYAIYIVHHPLFSYLGVMPSKVTHTLGNFVFLMAFLMPLTYLVAAILNRFSAEITNRLSRRSMPTKS